VPAAQNQPQGQKKAASNLVVVKTKPTGVVVVSIPTGSSPPVASSVNPNAGNANGGSQKRQKQTPLSAPANNRSPNKQNNNALPPYTQPPNVPANNSNGSLVVATPGDGSNLGSGESLYAGATFQNSPAANRLPIPVFSTNRSGSPSGSPSNGNSMPRSPSGGMTFQDLVSMQHPSRRTPPAVTDLPNTQHHRSSHGPQQMFAMDEDSDDSASAQPRPQQNDEDALLRQKSRDLLRFLSVGPSTTAQQGNVNSTSPASRHQQQLAPAGPVPPFFGHAAMQVGNQTVPIHPMYQNQGVAPVQHHGQFYNNVVTGSIVGMGGGGGPGFAAASFEEPIMGGVPMSVTGAQAGGADPFLGAMSRNLKDMLRIN
ncbi:hypothetical protein HK101_005954, partial [Irineochytrium annulatum]